MLGFVERVGPAEATGVDFEGKLVESFCACFVAQ